MTNLSTQKMPVMIPPSTSELLAMNDINTTNEKGTFGSMCEYYYEKNIAHAVHQ